MLTKINELYKTVEHSKKTKKLVLAAAQDAHALEAVYEAKQKKFIEPILVGNKRQIMEIAREHKFDLSDFNIFDEKEDLLAVQKSVKLVHDGEAQILMKGYVSTGTLLKGVLNKDWGLRSSGILSHFSLFEIDTYHKLLGLSDVAMNIAPDLYTKKAIIENAVDYMNNIGIKNPKVALLGAVETINKDMPATLDAAVLSKMAQRGQIKNCIVDGPFALDNAISSQSAKHKKIESEVAGDADLLIFPNIESGNVLYKGLSFLTKAKLAAVVLGATAPVVLTSRSDSQEAKLSSIVLAAAAE